MTEQQQNTQSEQKAQNKPTSAVDKAANIGKEAAAAAMGITNPFRWGKKKKEEEKAAAPEPQAQAAPQAEAPAPAAQEQPKSERSYTVQAGDTLWDIATRFYGDGTQFRKIASANNISNPDLINVGQQLRIPE